MGLFNAKSRVPTETELAGEDLGLAFQEVSMQLGVTWRQVLRADFEQEHCGLSEQLCADLINYLQLFKSSSPTLPVTTLLLTFSVLKKLEPSDFEELNESDFVQAYFRLEASPSEVDLPNSVALFEDYDFAGEGHPAVLCALLFIRYLEEIVARDVTLRDALIVRLSKERLEAFCIHGSTADPRTQIRESRQAYDLLGVSPGCTDEELKAAYNERVKQWHPDRLHEMAPELLEFATERLSAINGAHATLIAERTSATRSRTGESNPAERGNQPGHSGDVQPRGALNIQPEYSMPEYPRRERTPSWTDLGASQSASASSTAWRVIKVVLRSVWRFSKIVFTVALGALVLALVVLVAVVHLAEYWRNEKESQERPISLFRNFSAVYMLAEFLGLSMLAVRALLSAGSVLLILAVVAGARVWGFCLAHATTSIFSLVVLAVCLFIWTLSHERQIEFASTTESAGLSPISWVMGLTVLVLVFSGTYFSVYRFSSTSESASLTSSPASQAVLGNI